ncbi:hypothetical protein IU501_25835 [Nocardia otitidiscaviarum]|uniref:hypothetical protein n=1 Tax=Nocardia otitidiscaviarum TaxID=1823 RepID=UPI0004A72FCC|nr:hypothetical protein [Nocardia otitidiscaviarum]MBF6136408.1 hypothetical protein [Nocardia otitidiscaviarum]MBF6484610.1 hypothetical protein [Nocardia otitidiscaviarum]
MTPRPRSRSESAADPVPALVPRAVRRSPPVALTGSAVSVTADPAGIHAVGDRGALTLPAPLRHSAGIESVVVVLAVPSRRQLLVRPVHTVVALLLDHLDGTETDDDPP